MAWDEFVISWLWKVYKFDSNILNVKEVLTRGHDEPLPIPST